MLCAAVLKCQVYILVSFSAAVLKHWLKAACGREVLPTVDSALLHQFAIFKNTPQLCSQAMCSGENSLVRGPSSQVCRVDKTSHHNKKISCLLKVATCLHDILVRAPPAQSPSRSSPRWSFLTWQSSFSIACSDSAFGEWPYSETKQPCLFVGGFLSQVL